MALNRAAERASSEEPGPQPLVVRNGLDAETIAKVRDAALAIVDDHARTLLPKNYTRWVAAGHLDYRLIEEAGVSVGRLKRGPIP